MASDEQNNPGDNNALGFSQGQPQKKPERYNTQFLVANFEKEERRTRYIVIGVVIVVLIAGAVGLMMSSKPEVKPLAPTAGEPASGTPKEMPGAKAEAPKPAEAPKAADKPADKPAVAEDKGK